MRRLALLAMVFLCGATGAPPVKLTLTVFNPDGTPASAEVIVVRAPKEVTSYFGFDGWLHHPGMGGRFNDAINALIYPRVATDVRGEAQVDVPTGRFSIVAYSEQGWLNVADTVLAANTRLSLRKWARIEGQAWVGSKPAAGHLVSANANHIADENLDWNRVVISLKATTDPGGHFVIERVPPDWQFFLALSASPAGDPDFDASAFNQSTNTTTRSGETATVVLGGQGRPIIGKVKWPGALPAGSLRKFGQLGRRPESPEVPYPPEVFNGTAEQRKAWLNEFKKTPAYAEFIAAQQRAGEETQFFEVRWTGPDTLQVDDFPAGPGNVESFAFYQGDTKILTAKRKTFTVPPIPRGRAGEPLDIGTIELRPPVVPVEVGKPAPAFSLPTLDGGTVKLADFRGKYLLIDQWATWCAPCIAGLPAVRDLGNDNPKELAILGVSYDGAPAKPRGYASAQKLPWKQAWVDLNTNDDFSELYPSHGIPHYFLIGPDGAVIAASGDIREIKNALVKALSKGQKTP